MITVTNPTVTLTEGDQYDVLDGVSASDNVDGNITGSIQVTGDTFNENSAVLGSYTIIYNVDDAAGNSAVQKSKTINVESAAGVSSNLVISSAAGTQAATTSYIVNQLSWEWSDVTTLTSGNLLSTSFNTESGDLSDLYIDGFNTDIKTIPNAAFFAMVPSLAETTYLSCGGNTGTFLMDSGASVPDPLVLNNITTDALIWSTPGAALSDNTAVQIAQLTFSNTTKGTFRIRYADSLHGDYQSIILTVTNGELSQ